MFSETHCRRRCHLVLVSVTALEPPSDIVLPAVVIAFNVRLSDKGLAELDALLSRIAADNSLTFGV